MYPFAGGFRNADHYHQYDSADCFLPGATDWYIRWPYIFEGLLIGLIGSLMAALLLSRAIIFCSVNWPVQLFSELNLLRQRSGPSDMDVNRVGAAFGLVGSLISLKRFLKAS